MLYSSVYGIVKSWNCAFDANMNTQTPANSPDTNTFRRRVMTACSYRSAASSSSLPRSRIPQLMTRSASATPSRKGSVGRRCNRMVQSVSTSSDIQDGSCEQLAEQVASPLRISEVLLSRCHREASPVVPKYTSPCLTLPLNRVLFVRREQGEESESSVEDLGSLCSDDECDSDLMRKLSWTRNALGGRGRPTAEEVMRVKMSHLGFCRNCRYDQVLRIARHNKSFIKSSHSITCTIDCVQYYILH
ncbi:hypothetical protein QR680_003373 [Steinernema hermaphroditum]|uniref:Uncharacterized protein n=1 Tax=Steinernema hermaphroditum TaxID=289476 RepID=A0AA39H8C5_9BILA|nr:hypothetical protein QR680_003373 [Steinernema hermaphroditum]